MNRFTVLPLLVIGLLVSLPRGAAAQKQPELFDVICLADARPVAVRFDLAINGKPLGEAWEKFADSLFARLDANKNGKLEGEELSRLPKTLMLITMRTTFRESPTAQTMTPVAFRDYLRKNEMGPLALPSVLERGSSPRRFVRVNKRGQSEALDKALMELLDTNKDGRLSKAELAAAPAILAKLDTDENELISIDEILGRSANISEFVEESEQPIDKRGTFEMFRLDRKADPVLAKRLLERYRPQPKDGMAPARWLTKGDLKISDAAFAALDQDGNDELDAEELARFGGACQPEVALAFQFGKVPAEKRMVEVTNPGKAPVVATTSGTSTATITLPGMRLELAPAIWDSPKEWRRAYQRVFQALDRDANGYVDEVEARNHPLFRMLFSQFDVDGDRKIFVKELIAVLTEFESLAAEAADAIVVAGLFESGHGLFGLFDVNSDGQLSIRELRAMTNLVERSDAAKETTLGPADVPRRFQVTFASWLNSPQRAVRRFDDSPAAQQQPAVGPIWFQKMDRNRDGDLSRREFLGTDEEFRRLDLNGDGLIDVKEAEAAGKLHAK